MTEINRIAANPWKLVSIGMALVVTTALVTGVVVASRSTTEDRPAVQSVQPAEGRNGTSAAGTTTPQAPAPRRTATPASTVPSPAIVKACNDHAATASGPRDKTTEIVKDGAIGALVGAAVGAAGGAIADGGKGAGKGAAIGGLVGAGAGALYGVNENRKHDDNYRAAYAGCLRSRGYRA